jgi:hypothetical protein
VCGLVEEIADVEVKVCVVFWDGEVWSVVVEEVGGDVDVEWLEGVPVSGIWFWREESGN